MRPPPSAWLKACRRFIQRSAHVHRSDRLHSGQQDLPRADDGARPTDGEIWVNGAQLSITNSGSGGAIAYGSDPARIGSQGGASVFGAGFNGRIYMVALYRRSFTPHEVHLRARNPYRIIRRAPTTARAAQGSVPPPAGDSGKGSIVIAITC